MQLRYIELGDDPSAWRALGFDVDRSGSLVLGHTAIALTGLGGGFRGWSIEGVRSPVDGIPHAEPPWDETQAPPPGEHPNGIISIDHAVIHTGDIGRTVTALEKAGLELRRERTASMHGSSFRQCFLWAGDVILEVVGPQGSPADSTDPADTAGLFGLAFVSENLDFTVDALGALAGSPRDAVQRGRRIAGLRCEDLGVSLPLAVMSPHPR